MLSNHAKKRHSKLRAVCIVILSLSITSTALAYEFDKPVEKALKLGQDENKYGQLKINLRYRYENANQENVTVQTANGNTLRLRLGYLTPEFRGLQGFVEYEGLLAMQEQYNSLRNGKRQFSVIADPQTSELNQAWITFKGIPDTIIKGGRQRIKLDNDRFIGNVGWRQMEQTFDSVMITNMSIANMTIKVGYIGQVKTILSLLTPMHTPFLHMGYNFGRWGTLKGYAYWIDYVDNPALFNNSNQTYGGSFVGSPKINDTVTAHYWAEYAWQQDYGHSSLSYKDSYFNLMGGVTVFNVTLKGGIEQLNGSNGKGFDTPLATKHAFQGWADVFLRTPADGVRDVSASLSGKAFGTKLLFVYHNFNDDTGKIAYGNEYDFLLTKKFGKHYQLLAKYALYKADGNGSGTNPYNKNTQKIWLQGSITF
jgi:alginate export protein